MIKANKTVPKWALLFLTVMISMSLLATGCSNEQTETETEPETTSEATEEQTIIIGDFNWDTAQMHNRIAGFIIEHGYGYPVDYIFGDTVPIMQGVERGDVHITMDNWTDNVHEAWRSTLESGQVLDLGDNYKDAPQGIYVPTYVIKGDPDRGIEPMAPDLESVFDLPKYWELFQDPEEPEKGRFHNYPAGWLSTEVHSAKLVNYGLDEYFVDFTTGSEAAMNSSLLSAYNQGEPWVGGAWEPTWIMGQVDMTLLEEPPHDAEAWADDIWDSAYAPVSTRIAANVQLEDFAPDVVEFLRNYETTLEQNNNALAYMLEADTDDIMEAAIWFLQEYEEHWKNWVPEDVAANVLEALENR